MIFRRIRLCIWALSILCCATRVSAQSGNSGSIEGTVKDPSGASGANATVEISNPVTGLKRSMVTGPDGNFRFTNLPFNPYHMVVTADGFESFTQDAGVRSTVPTIEQATLNIGEAD